MIGFEKKRPSALERRLKEIEQELRTLSRDLRSAEKAGDRPGSVAAPPRVPRPAMTPARPAADAKPVSPSEIFPEPAVAEPPIRPDADGPSSIPDVVRERMEGKRRFAMYFSSGSIDSVRPLRQEQRVLRNKAIAMVVFMVLVLLWVLYLLF